MIRIHSPQHRRSQLSEHRLGHDRCAPLMTAARLHSLWPGLLAVSIIAVSAWFLSTNLGGPVMLYALLLGLSVHFLIHEPRVVHGVDFSAKFILRAGVALLGVRLTIADVSSLGWDVVSLVILAVISFNIPGQPDRTSAGNG